MKNVFDLTKYAGIKCFHVFQIVLILIAIAIGLTASPVAGQTRYTIDQNAYVSIDGDGGDFWPYLLYADGTANPNTIRNGDRFHIDNNSRLEFRGDPDWFNWDPDCVGIVGAITTETERTGRVSFNLDRDPWHPYWLTVASIGEDGKSLAQISVTGTDTEVRITGGLYAEYVDVMDSTLIVNGKSDIGTLTITSFSGAEAEFRNETKIDTLFVGNGNLVQFYGNTEIAELISLPNYIIFRTGTDGSIGKITALGKQHANAGSTISLHGNNTLFIGQSEEPNAFSRFDGRIVQSYMAHGSVEKVGLDTWRLTGSNDYWGGTTISGGVLETDNTTALGGGGVTLNGGLLRVGCADERKQSQLIIGDSWKIGPDADGAGRLELVVGATGECSTVSINPMVGVFGTTHVSLVGMVVDINKFGSVLMGDPTANILIIAQDTTDENAFVLTGANVFNTIHHGKTVQRFETSRYGFEFGSSVVPDADGFDFRAWTMQATEQPVLVPDLSTMVLTNIIGFEIPRAQNVNGPWVRMRGGELNDSKAMFNKNSYQALQIGWDKTFDASVGSWNTGAFFEGNWLYGRGTWKSMWETIQGDLKSSASGIGAGLYISRGFANNFYLDTIGRLSVFENKVNMNTHDVSNHAGTFLADPTNNYRGAWSSSIFNLAIEFGKDFTSKNERLTFNPYNRLIYTSAPSRQFDVIFGDNSIVNINNRAVDAWTNKLGARLAYKSCPKCSKMNKIVYVGADYYQGLSGNFATETRDTLVTGAGWTTVSTNRPKNDLSYGTATVGLTLLPTERFAVTFQNDVLFGEVKGWSIGLSGKLSF